MARDVEKKIPPMTVGQMSAAGLMTLAIVPAAPLILKVAVCFGCAWSANETLKHISGRVPKLVRPPEIKPKPNSWKVGIGKGKGGWVHHDFAHGEPHCIDAGTTGSGKTEFMKWVLYTLCRQQPPEWLEIDFIDLKGGASFAPWLNVPHVKAIHATIGEARACLIDAEREMWRRLERIKEARASFEKEPNFPHRFIVIDEGSLLKQDDDAMECFQRIAAIGREPRIHLFYGTQRPENTVLPLIIRDQLGARFCFKVDEPGTSEMMLGREVFDAYNLPRHPGRMIHRKENGERIEVQAVYVDKSTLETWLKSYAQVALDNVDNDSGKPAASSIFDFTEEMED